MGREIKILAVAIGVLLFAPFFSVYAIDGSQDHHGLHVAEVEGSFKELDRESRKMPSAQKQLARPALEERVRLLEEELKLLTQQFIQLQNANANLQQSISILTTRLDAVGEHVSIINDGQTVVVSGNEIRIGGEAGEPVLKGESFLRLYATHIHTAAPTIGGPTSPPIPQGEASALSTIVRVK